MCFAPCVKICFRSFILWSARAHTECPSLDPRLRNSIRCSLNLAVLLNTILSHLMTLWHYWFLSMCKRKKVHSPTGHVHLTCTFDLCILLCEQWFLLVLMSGLRGNVVKSLLKIIDINPLSSIWTDFCAHIIWFKATHFLSLCPHIPPCSLFDHCDCIIVVNI